MKTKITVLFMAAILFAAKNMYAQNIFPSTGNVGIGTTTPTTGGLVVNAKVGAVNAMFGSDTTGVAIESSFPGIGLNTYYNNGRKFIGKGYGGLVGLDPTSGLLGFYNTLSSGTRGNTAGVSARLAITAAGNVGIGTTTPAYLLDVQGNGQFTGTLGVNGAPNSAYGLYLHGSSSVGGIYVTDPVNNYILNCTKSGSGTGIFINNTSSSGGAAVYAESATPKFSFVGSLVGYNTSTGRGIIGHSSQGIGIWGESASTADYAGYFINDGYRGMYAECAGGNYAGYFNGAVYTTSTYTTSDARLKKNIKDISNAMDIIKLLRPKNYEFTNAGDYASVNIPDGNHYGLLAQDVEKVLPGLVKDAGNNFYVRKNKTANQPDSSLSQKYVDFKAINYTELIPVMIKALQEQEAEIKTLTQQVNDLAGKQSSAVAQTRVSTATETANASLAQNIPNPFSNATTINYSVPLNSNATINFYDAGGILLKSIKLAADGNGSLTLQASELPSGVYRYVLVVDGKTIDSKQMILSK